MAAFKPHYTLCPLLGAHNLVGISADKEESTILVTLGPNIIVKHKLSDQKPLKSWSTRQSNQITCHSIYDSNSEKYVGVLNKKHVCLWSEEESNLEDVKKHTFSSAIHTIHSTHGKPSIIVFENGYSENLDISIHRRKEEKAGLLSPGEVIKKTFLERIKDQIILVVYTSSNKVYYVRLASDGTPEGNLSFTLSKNAAKNVGTVVVNDGNTVTIIALWSDGDMVQYSEQGAVIATFKLSGICLSSPVAMLMLDATHMAVYGADVTEEGAVLLLFDLKFGMNVAVRRLKFFCDPPHLYCLPANNVLMLCVVQNLVVVPYILQPSLLWNLVDSTQLPSETKAKPQVSTWISDDIADLPTLPNPLKFDKEELNILASSLWESNASSCRFFDELLPSLKDDKDVKGIYLLLATVKDLPEKWLADLLNFALENGGSKDLLEILLSLSFSDVVLLSFLRKRLTTKSTISLLEDLALRLETCKWSQDVQENKPSVNKVVDWISLVLDAHHHELLIAGSDAKVRKLIERLGQLVTDSHEFLDCLGQSEALIGLLEHKKKPPENRRKDWYAIEVVRLL